MSTPPDKTGSVNPGVEELVINPEVFASLPTLYQGVARLLEREGKVKITGEAKPK